MSASLRLRPQDPVADDQRIVMPFCGNEYAEHLFRREGVEVRGVWPQKNLTTTHILVELADAIPVVGIRAGDVVVSARCDCQWRFCLFLGVDPTQSGALFSDKEGCTDEAPVPGRFDAARFGLVTKEERP